MIKLGHLVQIIFILSLAVVVENLFNSDWNGSLLFVVVALVCGLLLRHWRMWPFPRVQVTTRPSGRPHEDIDLTSGEATATLKDQGHKTSEARTLDHTANASIQIARLVATSFSEKVFHELFDAQPLAEGWSMADALAIWYALAYICLTSTVGSAYNFETVKSYALLDDTVAYLTKQWNLTETVMVKYVRFLQEDAGQVANLFGTIKESRELARFFGLYVDRILGRKVPFSARSLNATLVELAVRGETFNDDIFLHQTISSLYVDTSVGIKKFLIPILHPSSIEPLPREESQGTAGSTPGDAAEKAAFSDRSDDTSPQPSRPEGSSLMFIPHELDIEGRPELRKLPASVLFAEVGTNAGVSVLGSALYEPELSSLDCRASQRTLTYKNAHGGDGWVRIIYDADKETWMGEKSVGGKVAGVAFGADWKQFFTRLTLLGLAKGEACIFDRIETAPS